MKIINKVFVIVLLFVFTTVPVYAHRMLIEPIEEGVIKVAYADGTFSNRTQVTVYDSNDVEILAGDLDENGYFYYDANSDATRIVADDGLGHRVEWKVGTPAVYGGHHNRWIKIGSVVIIFIAISVIFFLRNKNKKKTQDI